MYFVSNKASNRSWNSENGGIRNIYRRDFGQFV